MNSALKYFKASIIMMLVVCCFISCKKDNFITDSGAKLDFSSDSILFDTVFTTIGSTTKQFTIRNTNNKPIKITSIKLAGGNASAFRINVDGVGGTTVTDVEIPKKDSLYVFVEVTVNPTNINSPLVIRDSIVFETNGNIQDVKLEAWGQDAYYHKPTIFSTNGFPPYSLIKCSQTWTNDKPHVIYGYAVVDTDSVLTMNPGTGVYLYNRAVLWVYEGGTLKIQGSKDNPVTFQGVRREHDYDDVPGQWGKIWLSALSKDNLIDWAIIKNGSIGVQVDTFATSPNPTLQISNTIIKNMSAAALYAQGSKIRGYNCVFANSGQYVAALTLGGTYSFYHCTFANYWQDSRSTPAVFINNWYKDIYNTINIRSLDSAYFGNCIVYGNLANELGVDSLPGTFFYKLDNCLIRTDLNTANAYHFNTLNIINQDPSFTDYSINNYMLTGTAAKDKGNITIGVKYPIDLKGNSRTSDTAPDVGAYEKQ